MPLLWHYPGMHIGGGIRPGIVHRIDRDTSGLLVIARNDYALQQLQQQQLRYDAPKNILPWWKGVSELIVAPSMPPLPATLAIACAWPYHR
jgi:hypothetical protein